MRQIRQTLRLHLEAGLSYAQISAALSIAKSTVGSMVLMPRAAGVNWAVAPYVLALACWSVRAHSRRNAKTES